MKSEGTYREILMIMMKHTRQIVGSILLFLSVWNFLIFGNRTFFNFNFKWYVIFAAAGACGLILVIVGKMKEIETEMKEAEGRIEERLEEIEEEIKEAENK